MKNEEKILKEKALNKLIQCPVCLCMVHPKPVKKITRNGALLTFYQWEFNCPKCDESKICENV